MSSSKSKIKRFLYGLEFFPKKHGEDFIYYETKGLNFNKLHHKFQKIMKEEFADDIKQFQITLNRSIYKNSKYIKF